MRGRTSLGGVWRSAGATAICKASATQRPKLALLAGTLAFLIGGSAFAQDATLRPSTQSRQRYVPQHFSRNGEYVPPHYETPGKAPFRGHFADKEAKRQSAKNRGYKEPTPDYSTGSSSNEKPMEGK